MALVSEFTENDIQQVKSFILEAWRSAGASALGWTGATDENIKEIASEGYLQRFVQNPNLKVFISRVGRDVVGFCAIRKMTAHSVELAGIIVRQDFVGKGIGSGLFEAAKTEAVKSGFNTMIVKTEPKNGRALSFYRGKGFSQEGQVTEKVSGVDTDLTLLRLNLSK